MRRKLISSILIIGGLLSFAFFASSAFFSDTETSTDNKFEAGKLDLKIDNESYYNGILQDGQDGQLDLTWDLDNLNDKLFFNFSDIKPSDIGEDTISIHVDDNDAWACMSVNLTKNDDLDCTEPELIDDPTCDVENPDEFDGELAQNLNFIWWVDDGDNVLEEGESVFRTGSAQDLFDGTPWALAHSVQQGRILSDSDLNENGALIGGKTYYIGKAWCFGTLTEARLPQDGQGADSPQSPANTTGGVKCDGSLLDNATQTDIVMGDIEFSTYQARNNPNFTCDGTTPSPSVSPSVTPSETPTPTPLACGKADVMLVLDRSGSIDDPELTDLKTAATAFATSLSPSAGGIHVGQSSFSTTASLDLHLTDNLTDINNAISGLLSGGFTNLSQGIDLATAELGNPGDGDDREDVGSPDKMIVITDGHPNRPFPSSTADDLAATSADNARSEGVVVFVVGVGSDVNETYLSNDIADDPAHYYSVSDYSNLQTILENLDLCE